MAQKRNMAMHWLDDVGAVLNQPPMKDQNRPPFDLDILLRLSFEDDCLVPLIGTRWLHEPEGAKPADVVMAPSDDAMD
eukprot:3079658-Alexandrium_andersonii.AAC.1